MAKIPNFEAFSIEETEFSFHPKLQKDVQSFLRCNPSNDGYVFVPSDKKNGKSKTAAYIQELELGNRTLIPTPAMVIYYKKSTDKFYKVK